MNGLCSSTPRGDGNSSTFLTHPCIDQLVYAAQPREGTETSLATWLCTCASYGSVYAAQPREGTETLGSPCSPRVLTVVVYAAQPREGTETGLASLGVVVDLLPGLCSSTPRGDGNCMAYHYTHSSYVEVYAAQPREGTETRRLPGVMSSACARRFMQLNPARGRKL